MDAEHKEGLLIISNALILLNQQIATLNEQQATTNELLESLIERTRDLKPVSWGPR